MTLTTAERGPVIRPAPPTAERLAAAIDASCPALLWASHPTGRWTWVSATWTHYTGASQGELLDDGWLARIHPEDRALVRQVWSQARSSGTSGSALGRIRRHDGVYRWFQAKVTPHLDACGCVELWAGSAMDVHELYERSLPLMSPRPSEPFARRAAGELPEVTGLDLLRPAAGATGVGVWSADLLTQELHWDERAMGLFGLDHAPFEDAVRAWHRWVEPEDQARIQTEYEEALAGRRQLASTVRIRLPSGGHRHIATRGVVLRDGDTPTRVIGLFWDVTREAHTEAALRASQRLLETFVRHAPAAIAMLDRQMCYVQVSDRWLSDYELTGQDVIGRCHYDVFPDLPHRWRVVHARALAGAVERCDEDMFPRQQGESLWLRWEARPWYDPGGEIGGILLFTQSISSYKRMELSLQRQAAALRRSNAELEAFAYTASHDLKEPLRAISGCAELLNETAAPALGKDGRELLEHIRGASRRMKALIDDLLKLSRVGRGDDARGRVDMSACCAEALANLRGSIEESEAHIDIGPLPRVWGTPAMLAQLLQNLLGNAIKYRRGPRPRIRVAAHPEDGGWHFTVTDDGIGIPAQHLERVFGVFQRLHTRDQYPGTGIGLSLCRKIVDTHRGRIWVESTPGAGSVFHFTLPDRDPDSHETADPGLSEGGEHTLDPVPTSIPSTLCALR